MATTSPRKSSRNGGLPLGLLAATWFICAAAALAQSPANDALPSSGGPASGAETKSQTTMVFVHNGKLAKLGGPGNSFTAEGTQIPKASDDKSPVQRPIDSLPPMIPRAEPDAPPFFLQPVDAPLGYSGKSSVTPFDEQDPGDPHFVPMPDRWRIGFPDWDRYDKKHPIADDYPYKKGHWWDPYNQNVLKGDYPIIGQNTFLVLTADWLSITEARQTPVATTPFESTVNPNGQEFFGSPNQFFASNYLSLSFDLNHGDAGFRPTDWRIKLTPVFNVNDLAVSELGVVNPDITRGTTRDRTFFSLNEWFVESKIADLSMDYDFVSVRVGAQPFNNDFRGFLFADINRGVRVFGTRNANRDQFNIVYFDMLEKDTNSDLNSFNSRHQQVMGANYYRQDFIWPGYTAQVSVLYNHDEPTFKFDNNSFLVRPDPTGVFQPHSVDVVYLGWAGDGHINRFNISHQLYWALGYDSLNPLANQSQDIDGLMAACELSYDRDWARFRGSVFYQSGDENINNRHATGFDTILDNPNFAGGDFSYWQRQQLRLFGANLVNRKSLVADLRSSKTQGQANFVNPGLFLVNTGVDFDITPRLRMVNNCNFLWFDTTDVLKQFVYQGRLHHFIGTDISTGFEYRPLLSNNIIMKAGVSTLLPGAGFRGLFNNLNDSADPLVAGFVEMVLQY